VLAATNGAGASELLGRKDIMVADTGASCHIFQSMDWMTNVQSSSESRGIRVGGQRVVQHQGVGDLPVTFKAKDGRVCASVTLKNVKISKEFGFNLFSLTRAMSHGWSIRSENKAIIVFNKTSKIVFDVVVETGNGGMLLCAVIEPGLRSDKTEIAAVASSQPGMRMTLMKAHQLFGHPNEDLTREMAKTLGIEITRGKVLTCEDCSYRRSMMTRLPQLKRASFFIST
jgi:DNA-directed RNA polymerase subunit RPC12/RpoP